MVTPLAKSHPGSEDKIAQRFWLRTLDEIEGVDLPLVGNKAFRLAILRQHGLNVPPGLILTTAFFENHIKYTKLTPLWMGSPDVAVSPESLSWLADTLKTTPIRKELTDALKERLAQLFDHEVDNFAVRSSATDEDERDHTFAGVHLTELGVPPQALPIAITRCWASAFSQTALEYRQFHGMSIQGIRIAVLIQPMLKPTFSGVGFTANPLVGAADELVIEAIWGLGEALVSGNVQPYFYRLANQPPDYPLLEQRAGSDPRFSAAAGMNQTDPLPTEALAELAFQLKQIQALMGEAQDVEWASQNDTFVILQTRPAALPRSTTRELDLEWTRGSHPEYLPDFPSPLFSSLLERSQIRALAFFRDLGLAVEEFGPYLKLILGRPYLNLTFLKRMISQVGIAPGKLLYTIGHLEPEGIGGRLSIDWEIAIKMRRAYWGVLKRLFSNARNLKRYQALVEEAVTVLDRADLNASPTALVSQLQQHDRVYNELFGTNLAIASVLSAATAIGSSLLASQTQNPATMLTVLAQQDIQTSDRQINQNLVALSRLVRNNPETSRYFATAAINFQDFADNPAISEEFREGFEKLLAKFGDRATYEADMGWPRYRENPAVLLRIIRQYAQGSEGNAGAGSKQAQSKIDWKNLSDQAAGINRFFPWRRWLAVPFVAIIRRQLSMRDELNSARAKAMAAIRRWDLALGHKWVEQGWLNQAEDIFWLTMEEIEGTLMAASAAGITLSSTAQGRKDTYKTYADTPLPFTLRESQIFSIQLGRGLSSEPASEVMMGLPISPGQVRGAIVVLNDPVKFEPSSNNSILVMPTTDPAWLPLLHHAAGLIVEMGGLLSHGSVIAREYGVPGVANIPDATKRFNTGDIVLVDGSTGIVQVLDANQEAGDAQR